MNKEEFKPKARHKGGHCAPQEEEALSRSRELNQPVDYILVSYPAAP
ncbi:MAG: hypothetical protein MI747_16670 [Desulfobacterales bacterium]|nr:hypothetical protein [Desulfobacterales bacterium]